MIHPLSLLLFPAVIGLGGEADSRACTSLPQGSQGLERLDRGLVVARGGKPGSYFVSWRSLAGDEPDLRFTLLRDGKPYARQPQRATSMQVSGTPHSLWQVVAVHSDGHCDSSAVVMPWTLPMLRLQLDKPAAGDGYDYTPNDCSVGDVDGDGQYELFVKWEPTNAHDNSTDGMTAPVMLDCYKMKLQGDGQVKRLWRINLGANIRAGAHYTQFMVYDFDGDGRAEMMCKTAPGSVDGTGRYVSQAATDSTILTVDNQRDWRNRRGRVAGGQEYLTVFDGLSGRALHTVFYQPNRDTTVGGEASGTFDWDNDRHILDNASYGNRGERYLAAVAFLQGRDHNPSAIFTRGYYSYAFAWAVDFDGHRLKTRWFHASRDGKQYTVTDSQGHTTRYDAAPPTSGSGSATLFANGNHNLSVADVDGDGRDELLWGSAALDDDGRVRYATGFGHGDAMHVFAMDPKRQGLQVFDVHENKGPYAWDLHDAATGEILFKGGPADIDNGRGLAANLSDKAPGALFTSAGDSSLRSAVTGKVFSTTRSSINFRIFWDGDEQDELLDGVNIQKWSPDGRTTLGIFGPTNDSGSNADESKEGRYRRGTRRTYSFQRPSVSFHGYGNPASNNWTKNNPCLQADLFGDWREEVIYRDRDDNSVIYIYMSQIPTTIRHTTLMHDPLYRLGIAWQNVGYNQPPHTLLPFPKH